LDNFFAWVGPKAARVKRVISVSCICAPRETLSLSFVRNAIHLSKHLFRRVDTTLTNVLQALLYQFLAFFGTCVKPGGLGDRPGVGFEGLFDELLGGDGAVAGLFPGDNFGAAKG